MHFIQQPLGLIDLSLLANALASSRVGNNIWSGVHLSTSLQFLHLLQNGQAPLRHCVTSLAIQHVVLYVTMLGVTFKAPCPDIVRMRRKMDWARSAASGSLDRQAEMTVLKVTRSGRMTYPSFDVLHPRGTFRWRWRFGSHSTTPK
jgi:hypothetical protein